MPGGLRWLLARPAWCWRPEPTTRSPRSWRRKLKARRDLGERVRHLRCAGGTRRQHPDPHRDPRGGAPDLRRRVDSGRRRLRQRLRQRDQRDTDGERVRACRGGGHLHRGQRVPQALQLLRRRAARPGAGGRARAQDRGRLLGAPVAGLRVIARTEALIAGLGLDEAMPRARTPGRCDAVLVHSRGRFQERGASGARWRGSARVGAPGGGTTTRRRSRRAVRQVP